MDRGKTVILGVSGSIAVYKGAEVCRLLVKAGIKVRVIMTGGARAFVHPLTFETLSEGPVGTDLFQGPLVWEIQHVSWARAADLVLIAPATANVVGKIASGISDDLLTATVMATVAPVVIAPAMNQEMYHNPAFQYNMEKLKSRGYLFVEPGTGLLACGDRGKGRLADPPVIAGFVLDRLEGGGDFSGKRLLITAGPTREALDPVRFISNNSSGKMGYALAEAARQRGGEVTLVSGPTSLQPPRGVTLVPVMTAGEMREKVLQHFPGTDIVIMAAAVADYRPAQAARGKMKKGPDRLELELQKNPDILQELGQLKDKQVLVGFAMETEDLQENAWQKLQAKNLDFIVANDLFQPGAGFQVDTNQVMVLDRQGKKWEPPPGAKLKVAGDILDILGDHSPA